MENLNFKFHDFPRPVTTVQVILEAGGLINSAGTTTHHLLICGDEPSHTNTPE